MGKKYDDSEGVWRTIGGRRVFIRNGQSLSNAMIASGKFKGMKGVQKDNTPSYKKDTEINHDIKHLEGQIENTRKENERLNKIRAKAYRDEGELSDAYQEAERELDHNAEYIRRRENDISILESRRNQIQNLNEFGLGLKPDQVQALRNVGNIERNQDVFENAYIHHKDARLALNADGGMQSKDSDLINNDLRAEMYYADVKNKYERMYGPEATRDMVKKAQETLDRRSLAKDGYTDKLSQDAKLGKKESFANAIRYDKMDFDGDHTYSLGEFGKGTYVQFQDVEKRTSNVNYRGRPKVETNTWARVWEDNENVLNIEDSKYAARERVINYLEGKENKTISEGRHAKLPGTNHETNLYKYSFTELRSLARAYGIDPAGKSQNDIIKSLLSIFK